ncbi:MAG: hypothetical protein ACR2NN_07285 [Bryobacteraceae bacterium]
MRAYFRGMDMATHDKGLASTANKFTWGTGPVDYATTGPNLGGNLTYIITPTLINELTAGYALWTEQQLIAASDLAKIQRSNLGITLGQLYPANNPLGGVPDLSFSGITNAAVTGYDARFPLRDDSSSWTLTDSISKVWNQHVFKAGVQAERVVYNQFHTGSANFPGTFNFSNSSCQPFNTGYAYAGALLGYFNTYTESTGRTDYSPLTPILEWYLQDSWRVTPRLTLDLGVRFTAGLPQIPSNNEAATFVPSMWNPANAPLLYTPVLNVQKQRVAQNPLTGQLFPAVYIGLLVPGSGDPANGIVKSGTPGYPNGLIDFEGILPAPRVGFAWNVFGDGKMAIRGGFGTNYNPRGGAGILGDLSANPPLIYNPVQYYGNTATFLDAGNTLGPSGFKHGLNRNARPPVVYSMSLGVQRNIGLSTVLDVAYVGSLGRHIGQTRDLNQVPYGAHFLPQNQDATTGKPLPDNFFRPCPGHGSIPFLSFDGNSSYHSLQTQLTRRFAQHLQYGVVWTWSKAMDYSDGDQGTVASNLSLRKSGITA